LYLSSRHHPGHSDAMSYPCHVEGRFGARLGQYPAAT
jgi:hypothetical protein